MSIIGDISNLKQVNRGPAGHFDLEQDSRGQAGHHAEEDQLNNISEQIIKRQQMTSRTSCSRGLAEVKEAEN